MPPTTPTSASLTSHELMLELRSVMHCVDIYSSRLERDIGLTLPQLLVLREIGTPRTAYSRQIAAALSMSQATVTSITDRLVKHGMARRVRGRTDKRYVFVEPTARAIALLENAPPLLQPHFLEAFAEIDDWERELLLSSLSRLARLMEEPPRREQ